MKMYCSSGKLIVFLLKYKTNGTSRQQVSEMMWMMLKVCFPICFQCKMYFNHEILSYFINLRIKFRYHRDISYSFNSTDIFGNQSRHRYSICLKFEARGWIKVKEQE